MNEYSPFEKEINQLDENELNKLITNSIGEGWYIEYKEDVPKKNQNIDSNKIAKSISAFANTKGGWLFFGVKSNDKNIATELCGIDLNFYNNFPDQLSQIISSNITPKPSYHFKAIQLLNGNSVFIIKVDESPIPPYITSQGIIYQRENNACNPVKERYIIEKLNEKAQEYYESIERFCTMDYGQTKGQSDSSQSYLELYLFPLPYNDFKFLDFRSSDFFTKVAVRFYQSVDCIFEDELMKKTTLPLNLGFNSIYTSQNSIIIRPLTNENIIYKTTTVELFRNGSLKFLIPLTEFTIDNAPKYYNKSETLEYLKDKYSPFETVKQYGYGYGLTENFPEVTQRKNTDFVRHIKMIDGVELIYAILILIAKYRAILEDNDFDLKREIGFRGRVTNSWRKCIFFDDLEYLEKIKIYNLPVAPKNEIEIPIFLKGNYYSVSIKESSTFLSIATLILQAIGLPDTFAINFENIINGGLSRFDAKNK